MAPESVLDYVVAHEAAHLIEAADYSAALPLLRQAYGESGQRSDIGLALAQVLA